MTHYWKGCTFSPANIEQFCGIQHFLFSLFFLQFVTTLAFYSIFTWQLWQTLITYCRSRHVNLTLTLTLIFQGFSCILQKRLAVMLTGGTPSGTASGSMQNISCNIHWQGGIHSNGTCQKGLQFLHVSHQMGRGSRLQQSKSGFL